MSRKIEVFRIIMFFIVVMLAILFSFSFSNWGNSFSRGETYQLHATFDEIGNLRVGAPVKVSGVLVGSVSKIELDPDYQAEVTFLVAQGLKIPRDSSVKIITQGILGGNYLAITPGIAEDMLSNNATVERSNSAFIIENFINKALAEFKGK